jgi:hypothetical protein
MIKEFEREMKWILSGGGKRKLIIQMNSGIEIMISGSRSWGEPTLKKKLGYLI